MAVFPKKSASAYRKSKTENQKESAHVRKEKGCRIPRSADRCERNRAPAHLRLRDSCDHYLAAKTSYQFGHDVFAEEPVASRGKGKEVTVQVRSGMEAKELGELLKDNGLIDESLLVFEVQYRLSGYYGGIKDGSYVLNTAQTVDEMLEILAGVNTEGQPSAE